MSAGMRPLAATTEWEEVDLSTMTADELAREQVACKAEIERILYQLADEEGVYRLGIGYPEWRRRARAALGFRKAEARTIHVLLQEKQREAAEAKRQARADSQARRSEQSSVRVSHDVSDAGGLDEILLKVVVAFRHLAGERHDLPPTVTTDDRAALRLAGRYLRTRFGSRRTARARQGTPA